jgi:hypothetical protein
MPSRLSLLFMAVLVIILVACTPTESTIPATTETAQQEQVVEVNTDVAAATVNAFLEALVNKDADTLSTLACADWEDGALRELDSFQAVDTRLNEIACQVTGTEGETVLVVCQGQIIATYNNEDSNFELGARTYLTVEEGGEWRVCGYR